MRKVGFKQSDIDLVLDKGIYAPDIKLAAQIIPIEKQKEIKKRKQLFESMNLLKNDEQRKKYFGI